MSNTFCRDVTRAFRLKIAPASRARCEKVLRSFASMKSQRRRGIEAFHLGRGRAGRRRRAAGRWARPARLAVLGEVRSARQRGSRKPRWAAQSWAASETAQPNRRLRLRRTSGCLQGRAAADGGEAAGRSALRTARARETPQTARRTKESLSKDLPSRSIRPKLRRRSRRQAAARVAGETSLAAPLRDKRCPRRRRV